MSDKLALQQELDTYDKELPNLMDRIGKFVLIKGDGLEGVYDTYEDALTAGYKSFGLTSFLVKRIEPAGQVAFISRALQLSCPA